MLQETRIVKQMSTPTKPTQPQASEPAKEATKVQEESAHKPESQLGLDPTFGMSEDPQPTSTKEVNDIAVVARWILPKNPNIAQQMMEKLKANPRKPLQLE